jgi:hypothetical protein
MRRVSPYKEILSLKSHRVPLSIVERQKHRGFACVYVFPAREFVKVGMAIDPHERWCAIKVGNPLLEKPLYVSGWIHDCGIVEKAAHKALSAYRYDGEWFRCNKYFAAEVVRQIFDAHQIRNVVLYEKQVSRNVTAKSE